MTANVTQTNGGTLINVAVSVSINVTVLTTKFGVQADVHVYANP